MGSSILLQPSRCHSSRHLSASCLPPVSPLQKKRCKIKQAQKKVETLSATVPPCTTLPLANGCPPCGGSGSLQPLLPPRLRDALSEGSSEGSSSHSDEPSFCGVAASCRRLCDSLPPQGRTRAERRAYKRRRSKPSSCGRGGGGATDGVVELLQVPRRRSDPVLSGGVIVSRGGGGGMGSMSSLQDLMKVKQEMSAGTLGAMAISGPP